VSKAPRYDVPNAAPDELRLVQLFVNTSDEEHSRELLDSPQGLRDWLAEQGVLGSTARVMRADLTRALRLREALHALLHANNDRPANAAAADELNRAARRGRIELRATPSGSAELAVGAVGVDGALARITATAMEAMLDGRWSRLKACRNCGFAFYDFSRNQAGTWCSMVICGNRLKTRRYRARRRRQVRTAAER
jgi:predicted RNA-binding Zn ribbon-like protein